METHLKEGTMSAEEWNNRIVSLVEKGILKDRSGELPKGFLLVYQTMDALVEDTDGTCYRCVGWAPPNKGKAHVDVKRYEMRKRND